MKTLYHNIVEKCDDSQDKCPGCFYYENCNAKYHKRDGLLIIFGKWIKKILGLDK